MKLYLSSYRLGDHPQRFLDPHAPNNRVAVIQNAQDCWTDPVKRKAWLDREFDELLGLGLEPVVLDLRKFFGRLDKLREEISRSAYCWAMGGNCFVLRRAYAQSGFDVILQESAREREGLIYGGYSAGVCVICPTLDGIHLADEPESNPAGYTGEVIWSGLGLYPYCIVPHYRSDHLESELMEGVVDHLIRNKTPFIALHDGETVAFDTLTGKQQIFGKNDG
jgi:dipeptidase E